jgi:hypothetical protein
MVLAHMPGQAVLHSLTFHKFSSIHSSPTPGFQPVDTTSVNAEGLTMDPLSFAATILQFVQCGVKLFKHAAEIYKSPKGCAASADSIDQYATQVIKSIDMIVISQSLASSHGSENDFRPLLDECSSIAEEIRTCVGKLRTKPGRSKILSLKKAVLSMASRGHVEDLLKRLEHVREGVKL